MSNGLLTDRVCALFGNEGSQYQTRATGIDGLTAFLSGRPTPLEATLYHPLLCLILQGRKETILGGQRIICSAGDSLVVSHDVPVVARVTEASSRTPYVGLVLTLDLVEIRSLYDEIGAASIEEGRARAFDISETEERLFDAVERLFDLADRPHEIPVMAPLIRREVHFRLLIARHGAMLRQLLRHDSHASRIARAIARIRSDYAAPIAVADLAAIAGMSPSSFHEHFKAVTATTPLQYQKELRLIEARRLLAESGHSVSAAAFAVGYESPTQFSREYSRKFGSPPRQDMIAAAV